MYEHEEVTFPTQMLTLNLTKALLIVINSQTLGVSSSWQEAACKRECQNIPIQA